MKKHRVLVIIQQFRRGGVEIAAINFASNLNREKFEVDYYLQKIESEQDEELLKTVKECGSNVIVKERQSNNPLANLKELIRVFKNGNYDIVHSHVMFYSGLVMLAAKICGVPVRVSHSHGTKWNHEETLLFKVYKTVMRALINTFSTELFSCSKQAGLYLYGKRYLKKGTFIPNAVAVDSFKYNPERREEARNKLGVSESTFLIGHIGTIYYIKNQSFLVRLLAEMVKENDDIKLFLVGEKVDTEPVEKLVNEFSLQDKVSFLGERSDIADLYQAFDIMVFPSLHEGLPVALIEAQAASLPCLISDGVTKDVKFNSNVEFLSLNASLETWKEKVYELTEVNRETVNLDNLYSSYSIEKISKQIEEIFLKGLSEE